MPDMTSVDYLLTVSEVSYLKSMYGEEIAEQDEEFGMKKEGRITQNIRSIVSSYPHVVDQEKIRVFDSDVPKGKRSRPNRAPENNSEEENRTVQVDWSVRPTLENREKAAAENRGIRINYRGESSSNSVDRVVVMVVAPPPPAAVIVNRGELSIEFKNLITLYGGSLESAKLVIEKTLFMTDVTAAEGRFSIPQKQILNQFLTPNEEQLLNERNQANNKMREMNVMLFEPLHIKGEINLRKWTMNKNNGKASCSYVLVKHWNDVVTRNRLRDGMKMQLWAFRKGETLCFALVKL
ncbi:hypothetical protein EJD97_005376 [Solanum chilense]|uniref:TF-B3 domain-containing protein n=1 Tax=Solanum chilense TaxID=4083 RepID=A0A6N2BWZ0_SOLCI|nr:hypothetical protein EJD97_005376 [Solanum chilense]